MLNYSIEKKTFVFKQPGGTSRGILTEKHAWFIRLWDDSDPRTAGLGECSIIPGLSPDFRDFESYSRQVDSACWEFCSTHTLGDLRQQDLLKLEFFIHLRTWPSILFGLECAVMDLLNGGKALFYDTAFTRGEQSIPINGLIWMGSESYMEEQIVTKVVTGFNCLKLKIGALDFEAEYALLESLRERFPPGFLVIRVDANGAFSPDEAEEKITRLSQFHIHSIEQPIKAGQREEMAALCRNTKIPIALDEELIGLCWEQEKIRLLDQIKPQYIILKPSLHGGISGCSEWIRLAEERRISWWITSALESNVGLNAIAQFTSTFNNPLHQGLGTGELYVVNTPTDLAVERGILRKVR